mgnify:CR=1 FL=1
MNVLWSLPLLPKGKKEDGKKDRRKKKEGAEQDHRHHRITGTQQQHSNNNTHSLYNEYNGVWLRCGVVALVLLIEAYIG